MLTHRGIQRLFVAILKFAASILGVFGMTPAPIQEALDRLDTANTAFDTATATLGEKTIALEDATKAKQDAETDLDAKSKDFDAALDNVTTVIRDYYAAN